VLVQGKRPRVLSWYHAGPMLFGDWGTSRLYVLGLAFAFTGGASVWFMGAMCLLLIAVGWAYEVICRNFPDGGGVYSAARQRSESLAVIGGLLLCADYVVTASLSALDAFHYVHVSHPSWWAAGAILLVGVVNYFGPSKAGTLALIAALATVSFTLIIAIGASSEISQAVVTAPTGSPRAWWSQFVGIILAISGVEAVANMTGIMKEPVARTARWSIWPVLIEIVVLNMVLTFAMQAIPLSVLGNGDPAQAYTAHRDDMLKVMASYFVGPKFAAVAGLVFAALLLSAVNTAVSDLVSIQFMMARDKELPGFFGSLNQWGMPVLPLVVGTLIPMATVLLAPDVGILAELYAIGVVGAIAINLGVCGTNKQLAIKSWERWAMLLLAIFMCGVWVTIAWEKPRALMFAGGIMFAGLVARFLARNYASVGQWMLAPVTFPMQVPREEGLAALPGGAVGGLVTTKVAEAAARPLPHWKKKFLVATRGNPRLLKFAFEHAQSQEAEILLLFIRHVAVETGGARQEDLAVDGEALALQATADRLQKEYGVPCHFLYTTATDVAESLLDIAVTHGVETVVIGASRRGGLWRAMKGDVIESLGHLLPESISLLISA
jgi:amino acid transporter/nucleotide-binding universal stress UspA family protein